MFISDRRKRVSESGVEESSWQLTWEQMGKLEVVLGEFFPSSQLTFIFFNLELLDAFSSFSVIAHCTLPVLIGGQGGIASPFPPQLGVLAAADLVALVCGTHFVSPLCQGKFKLLSRAQRQRFYSNLK